MAEIGKDINKAKELLEAGELVAIPTETVYGLAGNALAADVALRIFNVKNRPHFDPLIVHIASAAHADEYVQAIPEQARKLAQLFWPGPLTLVLQKNEIIPDMVTSGLPTAALRCPDHPLTLDLLRRLNFPLAAPSANPFGYISPTNPRHVNDQLGDRIPYILDGGACRVGIESTVIGFEEHQPILYRAGAIGVEEIEREIGTVKAPDRSDLTPHAPGQLKSHYAPKKRLVLGDIPDLLNAFREFTTGVLSYSTSYAVPRQHQIILSPSGNLGEAAQNLFSALRQLDAMDIQVILAERVPDIGIGRAINDRLQRAASEE